MGFMETSVFSKLVLKSLESHNETDDYDDGSTEAGPPISATVKISILLSLIVPSLLAYLFIIICILTSKVFRYAPSNYAFLFILFVSFLSVSLDIPLIIDRYRPAPSIPLSKSLCLFWWFVDLFSTYTNQFLVAWASFERHLLIFHNHVFHSKWRKRCFHFLPPILIFIYMSVFYIYVAFFYPCESTIILDANSCGYLCYSSDSFLFMWEAMIHGLFPTVCTLLLNGALLMRVYRSKTRLRQSINWRKYRTMIFQLIPIAFLYLSINFPFSLCILLYFAGIQDWPGLVLTRLDFFFYLIPLLSPLIFMFTIPEFEVKFRRICRRQVGVCHENRIGV